MNQVKERGLGTTEKVHFRAAVRGFTKRSEKGSTNE